MKKYAIWIFAFLSLSLAAGGLSPLSQKNWIFWPTDGKNGKFSKDAKGAISITLTNINDKRSLYTYLPVKAASSYNFSFRIKTKNLVTEGAHFSICLGFNQKGAENFSSGRIPFDLGKLSGDTDWKDFSFSFEAPDKSEVCQFSFNFGNSKGEIWIDSLKFSENKITIMKSQEAPVIDGKEDDKCWKNAVVLGDFYISDYNAGKPKEQTAVKVAYDDKNLYIFCRCYGDTKHLHSDIKEKDGKIWQDDCTEFFVSPSYDKVYQIGVNPKGVLYDSEITRKEHTDDLLTFKSDKDYETGTQVATSVEDGSWTVEAAIPLASVGIKTAPGARVKINFARENKEILEESTYSRLAGAFCQPEFFSTIEFGPGNAFLSRYASKDVVNPLDIKRDKPLFSELLLNVPGNYMAYTWDHNALKDNKNIPKKIAELPDAEWRKKVFEHLDGMAESGMMGAPLPWAHSGTPWWMTQKIAEEQYKKFGTMRKLCTEAGIDTVSLKNGGELLETKFKVSLIDPSYVDTAVKQIKMLVKKFKALPYIATVEGRDEPHIPIIQGKIADMGPKQREWDREVREKYGFGRYSTPAPNDPSYAANEKDHSFQWIAFNRWMSDKYFASKMLMYKAVKKEAPNLLYIPCDFWFMSGFDPYDYSLFGRCGDMVSCDPYASSAEIREGRGIYNHGFGTKLMIDLSGKPCVTIVQAYQANGVTPTPENLREWTSQALKTGASRIEFFELCAKYRHPELYNEMLKIAKQVTSMKKVDVPKEADCAIIISIDSEATAKQANADEIYTAYSLLGEKAGSWFEFVADRQLERDEKDFSKYKIIYLPRAKYFTQKSADAIMRYVENGGILVIGDPEAFSYDIDGSDISRLREKLCGVKLTGEEFKAQSIKMEKDGKTYNILKNDSCYDKLHKAHGISHATSFWSWLPGISSSPKVLAVFENGREALLENKYGKGKVIYFTANPFGPDVLLIDSKLEELFGNIQKEAGCRTELPIWRFLLPEK